MVPIDWDTLRPGVLYIECVGVLFNLLKAVLEELQYIRVVNNIDLSCVIDVELNKFEVFSAF